jgi:sorbitol-specific phosphotransferase system component IIA
VGNKSDSAPVPDFHRLLRSVAAQLINGDEVTLDDKKVRVTKVGSRRLRTVRILLNGREIQAIEQNRDKPSNWGKLARMGHQVVQFQDLETKKYVAVSVDGEITEYGKS